MGSDHVDPKGGGHHSKGTADVRALRILGSIFSGCWVCHRWQMIKIKIARLDDRPVIETSVSNLASKL